MNYYIDESGNTGDMSLSGPDMDFGGQPVFSLACVGIVDIVAATEALGKLRDKHNIKSDELKLSKIYKKKPGFVLDVVSYITSVNAPFFIEIVDKKYQLAVHLTNGFVWPPYFNVKESQETVFLKNVFADFICNRLPNHVFFEFLQTLKSPSNDSVARFFDFLKSAIENQDHEIARSVAQCIEESKDDFEKMIDDEGEEAYLRFLPVPDDGKKGKTIWMLPNYSCFTNMYARINLYQGGDLSSCKIIHDEQTQFDEVVKKSKSDVEGFDPSQVSYSPPFADYSFQEKAEIFFKVSHEDPGIQFADILAGLAMRFYLAEINDELQPDIAKKSIDELLRHSFPSRGVGINLVATHDMARRLFGENGY